MKKGYIKILVLEILLLITLLFNSFVFKIASYYLTTAILFVALLLMVFLVGYEKDKYRYKKDVFLNILIIILVYYFITYFLGFFTGFIKTAYSLRVLSIIKNTFPVILLVFVSELLRYELFSKVKEKKFLIILTFLIFVIIDINMMIAVYDVTKYSGLIRMICLVLFPSITKNIFVSYLTIKVGYKNCIFYRLVTELTLYLLPLFPDFGEYINILLETILPIIIMLRMNILFNYNEERKIKSSRYNSKKMILYSVITFSLLAIVILTSGYFKYFAVTIGSGSMSPDINKGDIVIIKKIDASKVKKGDILAYNHNKKMIVHRVVKSMIVENKFYFITKGDSNKSNDAYVVSEEQVVGITSFRIKYLGMPTVALNELLNE